VSRGQFGAPIAATIVRQLSAVGILLSSLRRECDVLTILKRFLKDESGATAIEYGLIAAGISLAVIGSVNGLGVKLNTKFAGINSSLK
jgi:pilus assembly protein Flp/PilA